MAVTSDPNTLRGRLTNEVTVALNLRGVLTSHSLHPASPAGGGGGSGGKRGSKPPWNHRAAILVLDLHAMARSLESRVLDDVRLAARYTESQLHVSTVVRSVRGGSDENTRLALEHVVALSHRAGDTVVLYVLDTLGGWVSQAHIVLGESEAPRRVPREPGKREPRCPWCTYQTLRMRLSVGTVTCINPGCSDSLGARPVGLFVVDPISGEMAISWRDGTVGLPEPNEMMESA